MAAANAGSTAATLLVLIVSPPRDGRLTGGLRQAGSMTAAVSIARRPGMPGIDGSAFIRCA
jgi:hypothetical protein